MDRALAELKELLGELSDLRRAESLLAWDMTVWMPPRGQASRAVQLATIERLAHERLASPRLGELLDELEPWAASLDPESDEAALVRVTRRDWEKARCVPTELASELALVAAQGYEAWVRAREESEFGVFRPWLERLLELRQRQVECFAPYDDPYDVLLDDYEPGLRTEEVRRVFAVLEPGLRELVARHAIAEDGDELRGPFPVAAQERLSRELVERFGARWDSFRLDQTVHPYQATVGLNDIRLTTRYSEDDLHSLFTAMHECGHGLYEWGVSPTLDRTPLASGASMALHESQSRLWENVVGRSLPFWTWFYPRVQAAFPERLADVSLERFHAAVNRARRSLVRVDADETTYGLHIVLRFELEQELLSGRLAIADLPEAWNARFEELMGIPVPNDRLGVLQDSHWSAGSFGYFPTYLLGSVLAVQIWERAREALPDLEEQVGRGEFADLHAWLRENLYRLGRKLTPAETIERVAGGPIDPQPYLAYLRAKLERLAAAV
ncbi:MAG TPA: carboxypeptidase M32 [Gaiellaceae bacterium]|nr:carboxypeptidase M32 [Gaiellaceae bacterium]